MQDQSTSKAQRNARTLRVAMTDSERALWWRLRGEQLGVKFRRQHPVGCYVADFACLAPKLVVELDGSQHAVQKEYDDRRDRLLRSRGFALLRFDSHEPLRNIEGVLTVIVDELKRLASAVPPSQPSPRGGRSRTAPQAERRTFSLPPPLGEGRGGGSARPTPNT